MWDADTGSYCSHPGPLDRSSPGLAKIATRILTARNEDCKLVRVIIYDARPVNRAFIATLPTIPYGTAMLRRRPPPREVRR